MKSVGLGLFFYL